MTLLQKDYRNLALLKSKLPPYCVVKKRKNYDAVYFQVPARLRPEGWLPTYLVGRTDRDTLMQIIERGQELYHELTDARRNINLDITRLRRGSFSYLVSRYKISEHYLNLKPATRRGYLFYLNTICLWSKASGHAHIRDLTTPTLIAFLNKWQHAPRTRKYYKAILSKLFQVAIEEGYCTKNLTREIRLPKSSTVKNYQLWRLEDILRAVDVADKLGLPNVGTAIAVAWEGFRQTDIFKLQEPRDYKDGRFVFITSKTGEPIRVLASDRTQKRLNLRPDTQLLLTVNDATGLVWTKDSFRAQFDKVLKALDMQEWTFRKIRNGAAIHALRAGLNEAEIKQRFGWSLNQVQVMLDYYTDTDQEIMDTGSAKLAAYERNKR